MAYQPFRLFNTADIFLKEHQWYYLTHSWEDKGVHTFPNGICPRLNVIERLEFELAYYDPAVQRYNHYTTVIACIGRQFKTIIQWLTLSSECSIAFILLYNSFLTSSLFSKCFVPYSSWILRYLRVSYWFNSFIAVSASNIMSLIFKNGQRKSTWRNG